MSEHAVGTNRVPPSQSSREAWKTACPKGHVRTVERQKGGYYCNTCKQHYDGDPIPRGEVGD